MSRWLNLFSSQDSRVSVAITPRLAEKVTPAARKPLPRTAISNISATGIQVQSREELGVGDRIAVAFRLTSGGPELNLQAEVRRIETLDHGRVWQAGCQFVDIQPAQSEQIIQFIFAQQRALARKR